MKKLILIAPFLALSGCSATQTASTPRSVMYAGVGSFNIGETTAEAQAYCEQYGRDAEYIPDDRPDGNASFRCVDR
ncbi:hypothetical protein [Pelagibacterium halotolerans]|uniref:hypothetical protein n=1 Tax=Pelagibacterium halotolerans TaxID=531813 RepID=UPI00384C6504